MPVLFQIHDSDSDQVLKDKLRKIFDHITKRLDSADKTTEIVDRVVTTSESGGGSSSLITHASTHENGGADEIDHDSLEGFVALEHYPAIDEDDMASDSDVHVPTQQSVKAYVDAVSWDGDIADIDLDGGTDIGAALADEDLILVDDGAGGTNRKCAMSRLKTYLIGAGLVLSILNTWGSTKQGNVATLEPTIEIEATWS